MLMDTRYYTAEDVLSWTVEEIQRLDFRTVRVKDWAELAPELRGRCRYKLQMLERAQDDYQVSNSRGGDRPVRQDQVYGPETPSATDRPKTPSAMDPTRVQENIGGKFQIDWESSRALVADRGRPCYPIELGYRASTDPGQYENIIKFWREHHDRCPWPIGAQLVRWREFREFQWKAHRDWASRNKFSEYPQRILERRRRHGLDGDVQPLEDESKQSALQDWLEYQDFELIRYEELQKNFMTTLAVLVFYRETLQEVGLTGFETRMELGYGEAVCVLDHILKKESEVVRSENQAMRKLRLAEARLETAVSRRLQIPFVSWHTWVWIFRQKLESVQVRLDKIPAHDYPDSHYPRDDSDFWNRNLEENIELHQAERDEAGEAGRRCDAEHEAFWKLDHAKELLEAARLDDWEEEIEVDDLVKMLREEVQAAHLELEKARESADRENLAQILMDVHSDLDDEQQELHRQKVLTEWIEQERHAIAGDDICTSGLGPSETPTSPAQPVDPATDKRHWYFTSSNSPAVLVPAKPKSILGPAEPPKVSRAVPDRWHLSKSPRRAANGAAATPNSLQPTRSDPGSLHRQQGSTDDDAGPGSVNPSRVSESRSKHPKRRRESDTQSPATVGAPRRNKGAKPGPSSTGGEAEQQPPPPTSQPKGTRTRKLPPTSRPGQP